MPVAPMVDTDIVFKAPADRSRRMLLAASTRRMGRRSPNSARASRWRGTSRSSSCSSRRHDVAWAREAPFPQSSAAAGDFRSVDLQNSSDRGCGPCAIWSGGWKRPEVPDWRIVSEIYTRRLPRSFGRRYSTASSRVS